MARICPLNVPHFIVKIWSTMEHYNIKGIMLQGFGANHYQCEAGTKVIYCQWLPLWYFDGDKELNVTK